VQALAVLGERDDALRKVLNVDQVHLGDVGAHRRLGGVEDLARLGLVEDDLLDLRQLLLGELGLVADEVDQPSILVVVVDNLDQLREVPAVPLAAPMPPSAGAGGDGEGPVSAVRSAADSAAPPAYRTRMAKVFRSLSSWSRMAMAWMIMLSARFTLNLTCTAPRPGAATWGR